MKRIMEYIDSAFEGMPESETLYKYKQNLVAGLTERANELTHSGLDDENVIYDLIVSEHPDLKGEYNEHLKEIKAKKKKKKTFVLRIIGSVMYAMVTVLVYLGLSFATGEWGRTWVFLVSAALVYVSYIIFLIVCMLTKRRSMFHPLSRILLAVNVNIYALIIFLVLFVVFGVKGAWLTFIFGVLAMMTVDGIYAEKAAERFAIFFHIGYIVPAAAMIYIILSSLNIIPWHPGWIMIPSSLVIVFAVIMARIAIHNKDTELEETEDDSEWKAN